MDSMGDGSVARFYDQLAADYHLIYSDWNSAVARQGKALDAVIRSALGPRPATVLDCACGIGTQAIGLALQGHSVIGSDISAIAIERAAREAALRGVAIPTRMADMRSLPFQDATFDVVLCADNSLPHLITAEHLRTALDEMRRVLRSEGLLLISTRPYDQIRETHPTSTTPQLHGTGTKRTVTFQLWNWHADGERYDLEHFQLTPNGDDWSVAVRRSTYWAISSQQLATLAMQAGFDRPTWIPPEASSFFQPLLTARALDAETTNLRSDRPTHSQRST